MRLIIIAFLLIVFTSCEQDCPLIIEGTNFYCISQKVSDSLITKIWYKTDTSTTDLKLYSDLIVYGGGEFCKYYMKNNVIDDSISVYANNDFIINSDTIKAYQNFIYLMQITKDSHETYLDIGYFIDFNRIKNQYSFEKKAYKFYFRTITTDKKVLFDSCIIMMK